MTGAFAHYADEAGSHLARATWEPAEYEYDHVELPCVLASAARARRWVAEALRGSRLNAVEHDDVVLLISELVTNAVRHARPGRHDAVGIRVAACEERIRIEVTDPGVGFAPESITPTPNEEPGGRGLFVVDAIASRWGTVAGDRHCVWLERDR